MALQESIDNFKTLSSQNGELIGQNTKLLDKINELAEPMQGKQWIVDAINEMGGNASMEDSLYTLGEKIEQLIVVSPETTFTDDVPTPINLANVAVCPEFYAPYVKHLYSEEVTNIGNVLFYQNNTLETVNLPNLTTAGVPECFYYCSALREVYLPKLTKLEPNNFTAATNLYILEIPSVEVLSTRTTATFLNCISLIDMVIGKNLISNANFTSIKYNPTTAYSKATNSLCHDTDLERYGQTFATNWDKWKWCIINHFAANLTDLTGLDSFTITFGSTVLAQFDEEMIAAFTDKNWTLA